GHHISAMLMPPLRKVCNATSRHAAILRSAAVGLACERYRLRMGKWPKSLKDIPRDILSHVPLDPFDGNPLRFKILPDGVVVYSIGKDRQDNGGSPLHVGNKPGTDIGFRLWNFQNRGLPSPSDGPYNPALAPMPRPVAP